MATTRFYLDLRGRAKDGKGSIVITIYHNRTASMIPAGLYFLKINRYIYSLNCP